MSIQVILNQIKGKKIVILGFGREGVSTYKFIRKHFPDMELTVSDKSEDLNTSDFNSDKHLHVIKGSDYDKGLTEYDLIFKTPGINLNLLSYFIPRQKITSQTELFLQAFGRQTIGVTGTKGKSTTSSLIYHILNSAGKPAILSGNIGIPFFDIIEQITDETIIVGELSAHQLEYTDFSPHIAIFLNMYQEHLDHFNSFSNYQLAKLNITKFQEKSDILIFNADDVYIPDLIKSHGFERNFERFSTQSSMGTSAFCQENLIQIVDHGEVIEEYDFFHKDYHLKGNHNLNNIMAAILACRQFNIHHDEMMQHICSFKGLAHRIEYVGTFYDILFYNDSISTIPEATIAALKTLHKVDTLIIGGHDRGIEYGLLIDFLIEHPVNNIVFTGPAGKRIMEEWQKRQPLPCSFLLENDFCKIVDFAFRHTAKGKICLLSPAASSYDQFKNFEVRGNFYKKCIAAYNHQ